jgi:hypothetical protein
MEQQRDGANPEIEREEAFLKENFGLSDETARATAEDRVLGVAPAESSYEVELKRIAEAQATEPNAQSPDSNAGR